MAPFRSTASVEVPGVPVSTCHELFTELLEHRLVEPPHQPGLLARRDRFQILRELGAGGMGVVLLARDPDRPAEDALVAMKMLRPELEGIPRAVERFLAEARHMQQFEHPNILRVLEISSGASRPYFVMPYLARGSLARSLSRGATLDPPAILRLARELASALAHAHTRGIIHRDLKPANVLLAADGGARLADFGLARTVFNDSVQDPGRGHGEGTVPYMSPAVARGEAEDTRCDIYGLGALLYELLTGRAPYQGPTRHHITQQILAGRPAPILALNPQAPPGLAQVAEWAMARELRHRYAHISDVAADLERLALGLPPAGPHHTLDPQSLKAPTPRPSSFPGPPRRLRLRLLKGAVPAALAAGLMLLLSLGADPEASVPSPAGAPAADSAPGSDPPSDDTLCFVVQDTELTALIAEPPTSASDPHPRHLRLLRKFPLRGLTDSTAADVRVSRLTDVDEDGSPELFVRVDPRTAEGEQLACFDFSTGRLRWAHRLEGRGVALRPLRSTQPARRGLIILTGRASPGDAAPASATHLTLLEPGGRPQWTAEVAPENSRTEFLTSDLDQDGTEEILVWASRAGSASVSLWSAQGARVRCYETADPLTGCLPADLAAEEGLEVLVVDRAGGLHLLNSGLEPRRVDRLPGIPGPGDRLLLHAVTDLDEDGEVDLLLVVAGSPGSTSEMLVLSPELELRSRLRLPTAHHAPDLRFAGLPAGETRAAPQPPEPAPHLFPEPP